MTADRAVICTQSTRSRRHVSEELHRAAYVAYDLPHHQPPGAYEVDHLIPLGLGGANAIANLWPEPAEPQPGFHEKDKVEDYLHAEVCAGRLDLSAAQRAIATDWTAVSRQIAGTGP